MKITAEKRLEYMIERMRTDRSVDAPAQAMQFAKNVFRTRAAEPKPSLVERFAAVLKVDLTPGRAAFGERSAGAAQERQMLFDSGDNAVDIRVSQSGKAFEIRAQVLGDGFANAAIEFTSGANVIRTTADEHAEFSISGLKAGEYNLTISSDVKEIFIEKITLH